jgi:gluconolactonase
MPQPLVPIDQFSMFIDGLDHAECVTLGPDGATYAGGEAGQIYRLAALDGKFEQLGTTGGFLLGICLDADRNVYACDIKKCAVIRVTPNGGVSTYSEGSPSRKIVHPNYPVFDARGNLYVTDSGHWKQNDGCVFRVAPGGKTDVVNTTANAFPNGCCLSGDGRYFYMVLSLLPGVVRMPINADGTLGNPSEVVKLPDTIPDGVAFDTAGNLFISCYSPDIIYKLSPAGELTVLAQDHERVTFASPTNIAFCGEDRKTLVVANLARWHLSKAAMSVAGQPLNYPKV